MDVFDYLSIDESRLSEKLKAVATNYSLWSRDQVFEQAKRTLVGVRGFFEKEKLLMSTSKGGDGIEDVIRQVQRQRADILSDADDLVMIHIDEPAFEDGLVSMSGKFQRYVQFCEKTFYPTIQKRLSDTDRAKLNAQLEIQILD